MSAPSVSFAPLSSGGWLATCICGWERFELRRTALTDKRLAHACATPRTPKPEPKARGRADWATREDSTWIDRL